MPQLSVLGSGFLIGAMPMALVLAHPKDSGLLISSATFPTRRETPRLPDPTNLSRRHAPPAQKPDHERVMSGGEVGG